MVYAVKHDGRHKARFVAGGHLTKDPESSVYSSVVNIRSLRIILLAAELNDLELQGADVGNAYLEALTHVERHTSIARRSHQACAQSHFKQQKHTQLLKQSQLKPTFQVYRNLLSIEAHSYSCNTFVVCSMACR